MRGMRGFTSAIARRSGSLAASTERHAGPQAVRDALETAEVGGQIADAKARGPRHPLDRPEESAHHAHARVLEQRVWAHQEARVEGHVFEVGARPERFEESHRLPGDEPADERIARPYESCCRLEVEPL
jgi:hypothetical protein